MQLLTTVDDPADAPMAFFNRISLVDATTKKRILPVFYSDNYFSVLPGESKTINIKYTLPLVSDALVSIQGWNVKEQFIGIK